MNGTGNHLRPQKGVNDMIESELMSVDEAAEILGITKELVRHLLIQGSPFGRALKYTSGSGVRYRYIIFRKRFNKFLQGELS